MKMTVGCCFFGGADDMDIVAFPFGHLCVYCVFTQTNTQNILLYEVCYAIIRIIIDVLRMICYNGRRY